MDMDFVTSQNKQTEVKPFPFGPYHSPLLVFKSYRYEDRSSCLNSVYMCSCSSILQCSSLIARHVQKDKLQ